MQEGEHDCVRVDTDHPNIFINRLNIKIYALERVRDVIEPGF